MKKQKITTSATQGKPITGDILLSEPKSQTGGAPREFFFTLKVGEMYHGVDKQGKPVHLKATVNTFTNTGRHYESFEEYQGETGQVTVIKELKKLEFHPKEMIERRGKRAEFTKGNVYLIVNERDKRGTDKQNYRFTLNAKIEDSPIVADKRYSCIFTKDGRLYVYEDEAEGNKPFRDREDRETTLRRIQFTVDYAGVLTDAINGLAFGARLYRDWEFDSELNAYYIPIIREKDNGQ